MKRIITTIAILLLAMSASATYKVSAKGMQHTKQFERCSLTAYPDAGGYSIGYGHHSRKVKKGMVISQCRAEDLFREDTKMINEALNRMIKDLPYKVKHTQPFIDGLADLIYNCGEGGVRQSTFWARLKRCRVKQGKFNKADYEFALAAVKTCRISCNAHKERRKATYKLMRAQ